MELFIDGHLETLPKIWINIALDSVKEMDLLLFILLYYNMLYKQWDIILHKEGSLRIGIVLRDQRSEWDSLSTETIWLYNHKIYWNYYDTYLLNEHCQWNVMPHRVVQIIWHMNITDKLFKLSTSEYNSLEDDDRYNSEEDD